MKRYVCVLLSVLIFVSGFCACEGSPPDYLAFQNRDFSAEVRGTLHGMAFCAKITVNGSGEERRIQVDYLSPASLAGVGLRAYCASDGSLSGSAEVTRGEMTLTPHSTAVAGLLLPASSLLSLSEIVSVQKAEDTFILTFPDGITLTLTADGTPLALSSSDVSFDIVWTEKRTG